MSEHNTTAPAPWFSEEDLREADVCQSCIGTGIGWNGPSSTCGCCNGRGSNRPAAAVVDADRCAFKHFVADPGEFDEEPNGERP